MASIKYRTIFSTIYTVKLCTFLDKLCSFSYNTLTLDMTYCMLTGDINGKVFKIGEQSKIIAFFRRFPGYFGSVYLSLS
jgi:hypothetical protein